MSIIKKNKLRRERIKILVVNFDGYKQYSTEKTNILVGKQLKS